MLLRNKKAASKKSDNVVDKIRAKLTVAHQDRSCIKRWPDSSVGTERPESTSSPLVASPSLLRSPNGVCQ
jgi:hypothetical protein